jgi:hypothetical protein
VDYQQIQPTYKQGLYNQRVAKIGETAHRVTVHCSCEPAGQRPTHGGHKLTLSTKSVDNPEDNRPRGAPATWLP